MKLENNGERVEGLNSKRKEENLNSHEKQALDAGYIDKFFPEYRTLMEALRERRDKAKNAGNNEMQRYFNGLRIYVYTIFENIWHGYLISYGEPKNGITFLVNGKECYFDHPYKKHLPFFSSAILHLGTCRDLLLVLLALCARGRGAIKNENDLYGLVMFPNGKKGFKDRQKEFTKDLEMISNRHQAYAEKGERIFKLNQFRNYFAHRLRLPWMEKEKSSEEEYFITRDLYNNVTQGNEENMKDWLFDTLKDQEPYENTIRKAKREDLISASEILQGIHDLMAEFLNRSMGFIKEYIKTIK